MNSILELRITKNKTQYQLSKMLGVDRSTVAKWESGKSKPRSDKLLQLSEVLGCSVETILREEK